MNETTLFSPSEHTAAVLLYLRKHPARVHLRGKLNQRFHRPVQAARLEGVEQP